MRTGGAGLFQSPEFSQATAQRGPALSIGARGWSMMRGGLPSGIAIPWAATSNARLANIAGTIDVDHAARCRGGRFGGEPADHFGHLVGRGYPAKRDVGDDLRAAAPLKIFGRHLRHGEARGDSEAQNAFAGIAA